MHNRDMQNGDRDGKTGTRYLLPAHPPPELLRSFSSLTPTVQGGNRGQLDKERWVVPTYFLLLSK